MIVLFIFWNIEFIFYFSVGVDSDFEVHTKALIVEAGSGGVEADIFSPCFLSGNVPSALPMRIMIYL